MATIRYTRILFLRNMCVIYLFAFLSIYIQIPGLNGSNGILPARSQLEGKAKNLLDKMQSKPTLLWLAPYIGLNTEYMMELVALLGSIVAFLGIVTKKGTVPMFAFLWAAYLSLFQVNPVFLGFQWDVLLLETGFLCILIAPLTPSGRNKAKPQDDITMWSIRWLLFRLMFASGIVKFTSGCPTWWNLSALETHFESQCIPTPLAWYAHHLPKWILHLSIVAAHVIEIPVPFLFLLPVRSVRVVAFYLQVILQVCIILTGNYNFFNLLTMVLSMALLNDRYFNGPSKRHKPSAFLQVSSFIFSFLTYAALLYYTYVVFDIKLGASGIPEMNIAITQTQLESTLLWLVPCTMVYGLFSYCLVVAENLGKVLLDNSPLKVKIPKVITIFAYTGAILTMFSISLVPYSSIRPVSRNEPAILTALRPIHAQTHKLHLTSSYGLFRRMTGVGGRPEVIIEGANNLEGPWKEYNFLYKPGNVNSSLVFVAPHQPRLDWQMWFAALGTYHHNPWIVSLAYRLLQGQPEVLNLLDEANNPFPGKPPKYIRASLYHYHYTPWSQRNGVTWWNREKKSEYFPIYTKDHAPLLDYLTQQKILKGKDWPIKAKLPKAILDRLREFTSRVKPPVLLWSMFITVCVIVYS